MPKGLFWRADYFGNNNEGGMFTAHIGLLNGMKYHHHDSVFMAPGEMQLPDFTLFKLVEYSKLYRNFPELLFLPYNSKAEKSALKIIESEKINYIYHYLAFSHYSPMKVKERTGLPLFVQSDGVLQWMKENWGKSYFPNLIKYAEEIMWETADRIFAVSKEIKQHMIEYGADGSKIDILPSAADTSKFDPSIDSTDVIKEFDLKDKFVVGFFGTFGRWHGVEFLAKSIKQLSKKIDNLLVLFVGDGDLRREVEDIIRKDNVGNYARIIGMQPYSLVPALMNACNVLTSPGIHQKNTVFFNSPVKLFEYMAMQKPVVATNVGQQGDVIKDRYNGMLIESNTMEEFVEKIIQLASDEELRKSLSIQARKDAVSKYDWKVVSKVVVEAYDNYISG